MPTSITLFPDTNVFLHYKQLKDIDWRALTGADQVVLVPCLQVIKELDAKKDHPLLGDRASRALKEIKSFKAGAGEVRVGVTIRIFNEEIRLDQLPSHMSPDSADDRIVYQVKQYGAKHPDEQVAIVTEDVGMELRCDASGVAALTPRGEDRLPNPQSELTKKNQQLTSDLERVTKRLPKLRIVTSGGTNGRDEPFKKDLRRPVPLDVAAELAKERAAHPPLAWSKRSDAEEAAAILNMNAIPAREYVRYNKELEEYFGEYPEFVQERAVYLEARARSVAFSLVRENEGTTPGEDIDVFIRFPTDVVESVTEEESSDLPFPRKPKLPEPPKSALSRMIPGIGDPGLLRSLAGLQPHVKHDGLQWVKITKDGSSFLLRAKIGRLKHGMTIDLGQYTLRFRSWDAIRPLQAGYTIITGNHPEETQQQLVFRVSVTS